MKKSNFIALILGTVSGVLFALGMCMALLPEWNAFTQGIIFGTIGLVLGIITFIIWWKMENKKFHFECCNKLCMGIFKLFYSFLFTFLVVCLNWALLSGTQHYAVFGFAD